MKSFKTVLPILCGAIAGAIVALIIASGNGGTKTVTDDIVSGSSSVPTALSKGTGMSVNEIYKQDSPGVVDIDVTAVSQGSSGFFSTGPTTSEDEGAGVVYDKKGDIITDEHVVAGATKVVVHFQDGYSADAKVLGTDASTDVAVIRVQNTPSSELHPIAFADSNDAQVGDSVVAIGSPFGLPETVTAGIVSATGRSIEAPNDYTIPGAIQTDAAINPGNSGGPLLDADGQVLGLNDQIETDSTNEETGEGSSAGVGFATPANTDVEVANTIISGKKVEHPYVGVCLEDATSGSGAEIVPSAGSEGCTSGPIATSSPAAKAGLKPGEVITGVDGKAITSADDFITVISNYKPGESVTLTVRKSIKATATGKVKLTLGDRPETAPTAS